MNMQIAPPLPPRAEPVCAILTISLLFVEMNMNSTPKFKRAVPTPGLTQFDKQQAKAVDPKVEPKEESPQQFKRAAPRPGLAKFDKQNVKAAEPPRVSSKSTPKQSAEEPKSTKAETKKRIPQGIKSVFNKLTKDRKGPDEEPGVDNAPKKRS